MANAIHPDSHIIREIARKIEQIHRQRNCPFSLIFSSLYENWIQREATFHSYKMEHPNGNGTFFGISVPGRKTKHAIKNLSAALRWGLGSFNHPEDINEEFIRRLAGIIATEIHGEVAGYRDITEGVRPSGATWTPPYPAKIPEEMRNYVTELQKILRGEDLRASIEAAAYAHLHLVRIHPFSDTNGRTARTLENIILKKRGLPPPVIYSGERNDYYQHLDKAVNSWRERQAVGDYKLVKNRGEQEFYDFIAGRINASLDRLNVKI